MIHVYRYISALTVLLVLCSAYAFGVAPWLEPPPIARRPEGDAPPQMPPVPIGASDDVKALFPRDHWVHDTPKVLETENCTLLIKDYRPLPDGHLELKPCALIFYAGGRQTADASGAVTRGRPIILEAPRAELTFDRAVDFKRAEFGKVEKGTLSGEIVIHSPPTAPGSRDELLVRTRAVWLDRQSIRTANEVEFQYGDSSGKGRSLDIALGSAQPDEKKKTKSRFGGVRTVRLDHLDYLRIATAGRGLLNDALPAGKAAANEQAPIEVTCQGEFSFDMVSQLARFEKQVQVRRLIAGGPPDQLLCEELLLAFSQRKPTEPGENSSAASPSDALAGRLARMVATGAPAVLQAPSSGVFAKSAYMEYSLAERYVTLKSDPQSGPAELRQGEQHFVAPQLHYKMAEQGRLGQLNAGGPGELRMVQDGGGDRQIITARWQKELQIQPHEQSHLISLIDSASVTIDPIGRFSSNELHLWVREVPAAIAVETDPAVPQEPQKQKTVMLAERLLAMGQVHVVSQQLDVDTPRLEAWFINLPGEMGQPMQPLAPPPRIHEPVQRVSYSTDAQPQGTIRNVVRQPNDQKFHVRGDKIRLRAIVRGRLLELEDLDIEGKAAVDETRTPEPGQEPMLLRGDLLILREGTKPEATIQVSGQPAEVGGRGMWLAGGKIQVYRGKNEMRIDGPGEATMPAGAGEGSAFGVQSSGQGIRDRGQGTGDRKQAVQQKMHIVWQQGLVFDGLTARFVGEVQMRTATQVALAPQVEATLSERVDFQAIGGSAAMARGTAARLENPASAPETPLGQHAAATGGRPELARVYLDGGRQGVYLENRGVDEYGEQSSREQMQARNLTVDRIGGMMHAAGPGWVSSVRRGAAGLGPGIPGAGSGFTGAGEGSGFRGQGSDGRGQETGVPGASKLTSVHVAFEKEMVGNLARRQIEFRQHVITTHSPANAFSDYIAGDPLEKNLPERMVLMQSDTLTVTEFIQPPLRWFEMEARGHTQVRGTRADIDAPIIAYSSAKETVTILGDGRAKAKGWVPMTPGSAPSQVEAEKIQYNVRTGQWDLEDVSNARIQLGPSIKLPVPSLNISPPGSPRPKPGGR